MVVVLVTATYQRTDLPQRFATEGGGCSIVVFVQTFVFAATGKHASTAQDTHQDTNDDQSDGPTRGGGQPDPDQFQKEFVRRQRGVWRRCRPFCDHQKSSIVIGVPEQNKKNTLNTTSEPRNETKTTKTTKTTKKTTTTTTTYTAK
jgi:hypothetical protein